MPANNNNVTYFDSFGVEHNSEEIKKLISNKNITTNIYRVQADDSIMRRSFCIAFIDFMLKRKNFTDFTIYFNQTILKRLTKSFYTIV